MTQAADEARIVWRPTEEMIANAHLTTVIADNGVADYGELLRLLGHDPAFESFYEGMIARLDLSWESPWSRLLDMSRGMPFAQWFVDARFNAPYNCVDRWIARGRGDEPALISEHENGDTSTLTFSQLRHEVVRLAGGLRALGVESGATVGISLPMVAEAAIALLAIGYIGAIAVPAFSGYGPEALTARLDDAGAAVLLTTDALFRRGRKISTVDTLADVIAKSRTLKHVVMLRAGATEAASKPYIDVDGGVRLHDWHTLCAKSAAVSGPSSTTADQPQLLLYTSGSTGKPKGVVHPHAGFALKAAIDQHLCFDLKPGERMLWYTDMGWMMGPWLVLGALLNGATIVLYDGTPDFPAPDRLWSICARHRVTHLGVAPTAIRALTAHGSEHPRKHDLTSLRILGSTGEPWNTEPYLWLLEHVGRGIAPIINYSGGTEIGGGILGCFPTMPLGPNAFHGPIPGMRADVVDADGRSVRGEVGELVLRAPWPGMTQSLWGGSAVQRDDERYLDAYWRRFEGIWTHGDWAGVETVADGESSHEFWYIRGRSDDTINVAGKRVGPSEFESAIVADPLVREATAIAVPDAVKGDVVVCLVALRNRDDESEDVRERLLKRVEHVLGHAFRPKALKFVDELPHTRNLKVMRRVARARYLKLESLGDLSGLENHGALEAIDGAR